MSIAVMFVSESELAMVDSNYQSDWIETNKDRLFEMLHELGLCIKSDIDFQEVTQHRNRLNQLTTCRRFAGFERTDTEWINSGYASREAKIMASGNKMLGAIRYSEINSFRNDNSKVGINTESAEDE